jgi:hypothetical protein
MGIEERRRVVFAFLDSEKKYIRDITALNDVFARPLGQLMLTSVDAPKSSYHKQVRSLALFLDTVSLMARVASTLRARVREVAQVGGAQDQRLCSFTRVPTSLLSRA